MPTANPQPPATRDANAWTDPKPLRDERLPAFPVEALPQWLREMVAGVATFTQTPVDLAAMLALAAVSIAIGKKAILRVLGDWTETLTFSSVTAMEPGTRKSAVFSAMMKPLRTVEQTLMSDPLNPRRIFVDDATPEAIASLMVRNDGFLALSSPEGGAFGMLGGRYGKKPNLDVYLKGFTGEDVIVDRKDRTEVIRNACLPMNLTVQPQVIRAVARSPELMGRGLLARLCYAVPANNLGWREIEPPPVSDAVIGGYTERLSALALTNGESHIMIPTPGAIRALQAFQSWLEPELRPTGDLFAIQSWAAKLPGTVARISGLLHLATCAGESDPWDGGPSAANMEAAIRIGRSFLIDHARAAFQMMGEDPTLHNAELLLNWVIRHKLPRFTRRDARRGTPSIFKDEKALNDALELLSSKGYLRPVDMTCVPRGVGRPPSTLYLVNPRVVADEIAGTLPPHDFGNSGGDHALSAPTDGHDDAGASGEVASSAAGVGLYVKPGDLWLLGDHRILCGDSTKLEDVDRLMAGEKADLCVTDPPYNVAYGNARSRRHREREAIANDNLGDKFPAFCAAFVAGIKAATKPGAGLYACMSTVEMPTLSAALCNAGFHASTQIMWEKDTFVLGWADYHQQHEPIWYGWSAGPRRLFPLKDRSQSNVWKIARPKRSDAHPTMKPVELYVRAIQNSSAGGSIVFEPFSGSGTAIIACEQTRRSCRAIELEPRYVQVAIERWEKETGRRAIKEQVQKAA